MHWETPGSKGPKLLFSALLQHFQARNGLNCETRHWGTWLLCSYSNAEPLEYEAGYKPLHRNVRQCLAVCTHFASIWTLSHGVTKRLGRMQVCSVIPIYIQQDATLHSLLYLETALHVSCGTSTHHQERIQLYLQHLVFVTPFIAICRYRGRVGTDLSVLWVAYATHSTLKPVPTLLR